MVLRLPDYWFSDFGAGNGVLKLFEQSLKIQPLIGRIFYSAIIKIEPIYIDVGSQFT